MIDIYQIYHFIERLARSIQLVAPQVAAPGKEPMSTNPAAVIDAMRSIQTEGDRWRLAEALATEIPTGNDGFAEIIDQATAAEVVGTLSATTLRLYRDTANRWPTDKRVANVSFSAHREVMVLDSMAQRTRMLNDLSKNLGPAKVTVAAVRKAVAVSQGKAPAAPASANGSASKATLDVLADVIAGSPALIKAISSTTSADDLDKLHAGLNKALAHVDRLRAKANAKATAAAKAAARPAAKVPATKPAAKAPAAKKAPARRKAQGDLRGL